MTFMGLTASAKHIFRGPDYNYSFLLDLRVKQENFRQLKDLNKCNNRYETNPPG